MSLVIDEQTMADNLNRDFVTCFDESWAWFNQLDRSPLGYSAVSSVTLASSYAYYRYIFTVDTTDIHATLVAAELRDYASRFLIESYEASSSVIAELCFWWRRGDETHQLLFVSAVNSGYVNDDIRAIMRLLEDDFMRVQGM